MFSLKSSCFVWDVVLSLSPGIVIKTEQPGTGENWNNFPVIGIVLISTGLIQLKKRKLKKNGSETNENQI